MKHVDERVLCDILNNVFEGRKKGKVEEHLKHCDACKNRADEMMAFNKALKGYWREHKKTCPSPEEIYEYGLGKLAKEEAEKISKHLQLCYVCKMKYEESQEMASEFEKVARTGEKEGAPEILWPVRKTSALQKLADAFNLAETSESLKESLGKYWKNHFSFSQFIGLRALAPVVIDAYAADTGEGFEKKTLQEENNPFKIEVDQFGKELTIKLYTEVELFKNSIVRFALFEKGHEKYSGILFVNDGSGKYVINLKEKKLKRPEDESYKIKLDVLNSADILAELRKPSSSKILMELMKSGNPEIMKMITEIIEKRE